MIDKTYYMIVLVCILISMPTVLFTVFCFINISDIISNLTILCIIVYIFLNGYMVKTYIYDYEEIQNSIKRFSKIMKIMEEKNGK